ncbi:hypothetical protein AB0K40_11965 [Nonomuraea bangladeshensis]|uniref:Ankyrin repeat domain-containing protein n=1 Tax=Nonomuraea bangladeshensis TaxID=404385 RepID=A0ABV3H102_9ACTN
MLGGRAGERFLLSDAQFVLAQEHGFRTWAEFRAHVEGRSTTEERPVSRLMGIRSGAYVSMADRLLAELRRNDPGALRRLRAYVPRHAIATSAATAELRDARLIIARESGFPTWRELVAFTEKSRRDLDERQEERRRLHREAEALLAGDTDRLAGLTAEQADTLLEMLAGPETIPGVRLEKELGVPRAAVEVLLGKATGLDAPLIQAVRADRVEYVRLLLAAGADPGARIGGSTPLENAVLSGGTELVDLLAGHGIVPRALWTYAACGRLDLVQACSTRTAGSGRARHRRAPISLTPPAAVSSPGCRRPTIRTRSWGRRSCTPASTAGSRSCAGSSTAASIRTSRPTSGGQACTGRSRPGMSR